VGCAGGRLKQRQEEVVPVLEEGEEEEEESEYETDSEDEGPGRTLLKPIFVKKEERETIAEREALEKVRASALHS
jgi:microfibrillar-associated protein 1